LDASPGDTDIGRRLLFVPRFPTNSTYDDGGFRSSRTYLVQLVGGDRINGTVIRDRNGKGLLAPTTFTFSTVEGTSAAQLFRNPLAGGPAVPGGTVPPEVTGGEVALNELGSPPVEIRIRFNQALNPARTNVPVDVDTNPLLRNKSARGRVWLEYDDPQFGPN